MMKILAYHFKNLNDVVSLSFILIDAKTLNSYHKIDHLHSFIPLDAKILIPYNEMDHIHLPG